MARAVPIALTLAAFLTAVSCAPARTAYDYPYHQSGVALRVEPGVVESVRPVKIQGPDTGVGASVGMTTGMIAGSAMGDGGAGTGLAMLGGALIGGLVGSAAEQSARQRDGFEIAVALDTGDRVVVVQEAFERFYAGDEVELLTAPDGTSRVQHPKRQP
jgi:outer membrane lipoprotein SlyB